MERQEVMITQYAEMLDMIACFSIMSGAKPKKRKKKMTYDDAMKLR